MGKTTKFHKVYKYLRFVFHSDTVPTTIKTMVKEGFSNCTNDEILEVFKKHEYEINLPSDQEIRKYLDEVVGMEHALDYTMSMGFGINLLCKEFDNVGTMMSELDGRFHMVLTYYCMKKVMYMTDVLETCPLELIGTTEEILTYAFMQSAYKELTYAVKKNNKLETIDYKVTIDDIDSSNDPLHFRGNLSDFIKSGNLGEDYVKEHLAMSLKDQVKCARDLNYRVVIEGEVKKYD